MACDVSPVAMFLFSSYLDTTLFCKVGGGGGGWWWCSLYELNLHKGFWHPSYNLKLEQKGLFLDLFAFLVSASIRGCFSWSAEI